MLKSAEVSGEDADAEESLTTTLAGAADASTTGADSAATGAATLLGLGSFLGAASETVAVTVGVVVSAEVAAVEVLDVLTILFDYTHNSSVFLSSFQYILYIVNLY
jgi:hypothetical protein